MNIRWILIMSAIIAFFPLISIAASSPSINLNYAEFVVPSADYQAIKSNSFLKDYFSASDEEVNCTDPTNCWRSFFLGGQQTYVEIFEQSPNALITNGNIFLTTEKHVGDIELVRTQVAQTFEAPAETVFENVTYALNGKIINWFKDFYVMNHLPNYVYDQALYVMEYAPEFLREKYPNDPTRWGITRKQYNFSWYRSDRMLRDLYEIEYRLNPTEFEEQVRMLRVLKVRLLELGNEVWARGEGFRLHLTRAPGNSNQNGIQSLKFKIAHQTDTPKTIQIGPHVRLLVNSDEAVLHLDYRGLDPTDTLTSTKPGLLPRPLRSGLGRGDETHTLLKATL